MKKKNNNILVGLIIIFILIIGFLIINNLNNKTGQLKQIDYKTLTEKTNNKESFILVVSRSNCSHCLTYKPKVEQIAKEYGITIYYIDYDSEKEKTTNKFLKDYNLDGSTPITLFIEKGKETSILNRLEGDVENDKIIERFKKMKFIK